MAPVLLASPERLVGSPELLDGPVADPALLRGSLSDLARVNRLLGGVALSRAALLRLVPELARPAGSGAPTGPVRLLDVGTGGAELPAALLDWAERRGVQLLVEAVDLRPEIVAVARERHGGRPGLTLAVADALALPYPDRAFDVVHASLFTHHFDPPDLVRVLAGLGRVTSRGVIVNDLDRARRWYLLARLVTTLFTGNPITRHDGPLSTRRAYRPAELARLAERAGLVETARIGGLLGYRYALVLRPATNPGATGWPAGAYRST